MFVTGLAPSVESRAAAGRSKWCCLDRICYQRLPDRIVAAETAVRVSSRIGSSTIEHRFGDAMVRQQASSSP